MIFPKLQGIPGYEERSMVSVNCRHDHRSCIVDGPSTLVVDDTHLKVYGWYDNERGYSCPIADPACAVGRWTGHWAEAGHESILADPSRPRNNGSEQQ
ncbi:MAG: hypothetical protein F4Z75_05355 [Synechococcus sp. SB0668_bin_15]|nr:hypothetical protein [Synechococcus sp. SB0668_bin_15]MXZ83406.1 hypothetical protein [Synechococcus sp. SB0666_bin_14]MYC50461.1 hypothetical protein [Synechococcus sp. SB0662_bin_14]MYG46902.1 hypothetical protein [Synechococcus sp. SB0675_bin_6]MYJ59443.1 hypothetical protein [Synechococcus sp. SB0672_bin_6]MYK90799.1 hypothetical protein [Synechococcus sp. SB0669_bin_8]